MAHYVSGSTNEFLHFVALSTADHVSRVTGLTSFNVYAAATSASTGSTYGITVAEVNSTQMPGVYRVQLNDSTLMTIASGVDHREICLHITSSMDPVTRTFDLYRRAVTSGVTLTVNSSGEPTNVMSALSSIATTLGTIGTKVSSIDTDIDTAITDIAAVKAETTAIKAKTDSLTFTVANQVRADIRYVNGTQVQGTGTTTDTWRPV